MPKYYYCPIGDLGSEITETNYIAHSYNSHGWGKVDWNIQNALGKEHTPVYSMTDGVISGVYARSTDGEAGYIVIIATDKQAYEADDNGNLSTTKSQVYINYLELDALSGQCAEIAGVEADKITSSFGTINKYVKDQNIQIKMGEQIGWTNNRYAGSNVHIDFKFGDRYGGGYPGGNDRKYTPHVKLSESSSEYNIPSSYDNYVPLNGGGKSVWPITSPDKDSGILAYMVMCQMPQYFEDQSSGAGSYSGDTATLLSKVKDWCSSHGNVGSKVNSRLGSESAINAVIEIYNAFAPYFNELQTCAIVSNALSENWANCMRGGGEWTWGLKTAKGTYNVDSNGETTGGLFALNPWRTKYKDMQEILASHNVSVNCSMTSDPDGLTGTKENQAIAFTDIFKQQGAGKRYALGDRSTIKVTDINGKDVTMEVRNGTTAMKTGGLQTYTGNSATVCCAIFERAFEGSVQSEAYNISGRYWSAACLYECITGKTTT